MFLWIISFYCILIGYMCTSEYVLTEKCVALSKNNDLSLGKTYSYKDI